MMSGQGGTSSGRLLSYSRERVRNVLHSRRTSMDPNWLTAFAALIAAVATFISAVRNK